MTRFPPSDQDDIHKMNSLRDTDRNGRANIARLI